MEKCNQVLDYISTHPNATIRYHASNIILMMDTYDAYLIIPVYQSHIEGHYYLQTVCLIILRVTTPQAYLF